jgi:hypothetical protein
MPFGVGARLWLSASSVKRGPIREHPRGIRRVIAEKCLSANCEASPNDWLSDASPKDPRNLNSSGLELPIAGRILSGGAMTSIFDDMRKAAQVIASHATDRIAELDLQIAEIEDEKTKIQTERMKARDALQRAANFPVKSGADYLCPLCWVDEGKMSPLKRDPRETRSDIFRCGLCNYEAVIPA